MIPIGFGYGEQPMSDPFQPFVSRAPNGFAGGFGRPPMRPMSDPFQPFTDNPVGIAGGTGTPPMGRGPFRRSDEGIPLWMQLGQPNPNQPTGTAGGAGNPMQDAFQRFLSAQGQGGFPSQPYNNGFNNPFSIVGGGTGTPPIQPMSDMFKPQISGGPIGQPMSDMFKPQISGGPVGIAGGVGTPAIGDDSMYAPDYRVGGKYGPTPPQPFGVAGGGTGNLRGQVQQVQQIAGGGTGSPNQPYNNGFNNPGQPPMALKKGGFAVKAVWDKKRPKDLGKPKDLSAKKEKSAKARAKAAGRPYPNLIDNMAVARKKGK